MLIIWPVLYIKETQTTFSFIIWSCSMYYTSTCKYYYYTFLYHFSPGSTWLLLLGFTGFPGDTCGKELYNGGDIRDAVSIPGLGRSQGEGHGNLLKYSCLENPMDRGGWWATVHWVAKSWTQVKRLNTHTLGFTLLCL